MQKFKEIFDICERFFKILLFLFIVVSFILYIFYPPIRKIIPRINLQGPEIQIPTSEPPVFITQTQSQTTPIDRLTPPPITTETQYDVTELTPAISKTVQIKLSSETPTGLPTATLQPSNHPLGEFIVPGNSNSGVRITIPESGNYQFSYVGGAYSTYAIGESPPNLKTWLTAVMFFDGNTAQWDETRLRSENRILKLADNSYFATEKDALSAAQGQYVTRYFNQGDVITLIAVDYFNYYVDNPGQVFIQWAITK